MKLYEEIVLSETEEEVLKEHLSNPTVVKYLRGLANTLAFDVITAYDRINEPSDMYIRRNLFAQGSMSTVEQLLEIASKPVV